MPTLADLLDAADSKFNAPQGYGTLADMARGAAAATVPSWLGGPVDLATMLLNVPLSAVGKKIENPVLGSQHMARLMGLAGPQKADGAPMNSYDKGYLLSSLVQMAAPFVAPAVASRGRMVPAKQDGAINVDALRERFPSVDFDVSQRGDLAVLHKVVVPKHARDKGIGSDFMQALVKAADEDGARLALSPSSDFGGSKVRLMDFYKRFGFAENKGKARDLSISETMIRIPKD